MTKETEQTTKICLEDLRSFDRYELWDWLVDWNTAINDVVTSKGGLLKGFTFRKDDIDPINNPRGIFATIGFLIQPPDDEPWRLQLGTKQVRSFFGVVKTKPDIYYEKQA